MQSFLNFVAANKTYFDAAHALSAVINLLGWSLGAILLTIAWRRNTIRSVTVGPMQFQLQEAAVEAAATAARSWPAPGKGEPIDVAKIRDTVSHAFSPLVSDKLIGKSILWVDDNPRNNWLVVRALNRLQLDIMQVETTEASLEAMKSRHFDLVISDMGRGDDMTAGYKLLSSIRASGNQIPFFIFAGSDTSEFRRIANERGAQLSTNNVLELIDQVVKHLS